MDIFDSWNEEKKQLHIKPLQEFYVNPREIWYTKMGQNIGFEENGKKEYLRPVLVVKKVGSLFLTVALTSKGKDNRYYYKLQNPGLVPKNEQYIGSSYVILSQIKVIDKRRFTQYVGIVSNEEFVAVKKRLKTLLF